MINAKQIDGKKVVFKKKKKIFWQMWTNWMDMKYIYFFLHK